MIKNTEPENETGGIPNEFPSDDYVLAIGKFVVTFSRFEERVATITALLFGCEPEVIANIAYSLDMNNRCQALRGIMAYRLGSREKVDQGLNLKRDEDTRDLDKLFKKVHTAIQKRNILIHSSWHADTVNGLAHRLSPKGRQVTGYPGGSITRVKLPEIEEDTKFVDQLDEELWRFFWSHFGNWILKRARNNEGGITMIRGEEDQSPT